MLLFYLVLRFKLKSTKQIDGITNPLNEKDHTCNGCCILAEGEKRIKNKLPSLFSLVAGIGQFSRTRILLLSVPASTACLSSTSAASYDAAH
jgi:hypothetical protein